MSGKSKIAPSCFSRSCSFSDDQNFRPSGTSWEGGVSEPWSTFGLSLLVEAMILKAWRASVEEEKQVWKPTLKTIPGCETLLLSMICASAPWTLSSSTQQSRANATGLTSLADMVQKPYTCLLTESLQNSTMQTVWQEDVNCRYLTALYRFVT